MSVDTTKRPTKVMTVDPKVGEYISVVGDTYRIIMGAKQTGESFAAIDMFIPPQGGPGPHAHAEIEETFYVIEGELVVRSESQTYTAKKGSFVRIPRGGAIHSFTNETDKDAHILCVVIPAGLDEMFEEIGKPVEPGKFLPKPEMTPEYMKEIKAAAARHGQEVFPPDYLTKK